MILKKLAVSAALAASALGFASSAHAINTDIIFVVDESGSMGSVQANLRTQIGLFASILSGGGVNANYGLVGYGDSSVVPRMITDLTTAANFATAALGLRISGGTEPGYTASAFALNALDGQSSVFSYRSNAVKNIILFTDEPSNGDTAARGTVGGLAVTKSIVDGLLTTNNALYNAVISGTSTINSYETLATGHSGQVFNLNTFASADLTAVTAFVTAFANAKLQETIDFCTANPTAPECQTGNVPEPGILALLGVGMFGIGWTRRRNGSTKRQALAAA
jgi:hypothetical protein